VIIQASGKPDILVAGEAAACLAALEATEINVTISNARKLALAVVILARLA
jgi:phosphopantetheinyl transferase (holo-ACP synthase)